MKKVLLALIVVGVIAVGVFLKTGTGVSLKPEQVISEDVTLFMDIQDLETEVEYFNQTKMGKVINNIDLKNLMTELKATPEDIKEMEEAIAELTEDMPIYKQLLGEQVVIAFDSSNIKDADFSNDQTIVQQLLSGLIVAMKPKMGTTALKLIDSNIANDTVIATEEYKGRTIKTIEEKTDDATIHINYALTNGLLLCTFDLDNIKQCIDNADNPSTAKSLSNSSEFTNLLAKFKTGYKSFAVIKLGQFYKDAMNAVEKQTSDISGPAKAQMKAQLAIADSIYGSYDTISGASYRAGNIATSSVITTLNKGKISPLIKSQLGASQDVTKSAQYTTNNASIHLVSAFDFSEYFKFMQTTGQLPPQQAEMAKMQFKAMTNTSFDAFIKAFGTSIGFNLEGINTSAPFPVPNLSIFFKLESRKTIEDTINNVMAKGMIPVPLENEQYGEASLKSVTTPFATPAIGFHNEMLFISSSKEYLKKMVDAQSKSQSLAGTADYKKYIHQSEAISHMYVQGEELSNALKSAVNFAKKTPNMSSPESTYVMDQVVSPLIDSLSMYKLISQTTFKDGNDIKIESTTVIQ